MKSLWSDVIEDGHLLSVEQTQAFEEFMEGLQWPSQIGRLPVNTLPQMAFEQKLTLSSRPQPLV